MTAIMPFAPVDQLPGSALLRAAQSVAPVATAGVRGAADASLQPGTPDALVFAGVLAGMFARALLPVQGKPRGVEHAGDPAAIATDSPPEGTDNDSAGAAGQAARAQAGNDALIGAIGNPTDEARRDTSLKSGTPETAEPHDAVARKGDDAAESATSTTSVRDAATADPSRVVSDPQLLQPGFRAKLERVIARMKEDHGRTVTVAETWRSQGRQEMLHEQGRTTPGAIVTWTRHSKHTQGLAADLIVDGRWDNAEGYAQLQQVAREEGLHTLGARDPGHVELAAAVTADDIMHVATITGLSVESATRGESTEVSAATRSIELPTPAASLHSPGTDSRVARVARVATVATVATVAAVARVGARSRSEARSAQRTSDSIGTGRTTMANAAVADTTVHQAPARTNASDADRLTAADSAAPRLQSSPVVDADGHARPRSRDAQARTPDEHEGSASPARPANQRSTEQTAGIADDVPRSSVTPRIDAAPAVRHGNPAPAATPVREATPIGVAERAAHVAALQDARDSQPVSHMTLRIDNADGAEDRIRVDMRGTHVDATINVQDAAMAARLADNIHDLARALESRDLSPDSLRTRFNAGILPSADLDHGTLARTDAFQARVGTMLADSALPAARSRSEGRDQRPQHDFARQRQRRDHQGNPQ